MANLAHQGVKVEKFPAAAWEVGGAVNALFKINETNQNPQLYYNGTKKAQATGALKVHLHHN